MRTARLRFPWRWPRGDRDRNHLSWDVLPLGAQIYVALVVAAGTVTFVALFPLEYPRPWLFASLLLAACVTAAWKVNLLIPLSSSSTLSASSAAKLAALLLLGTPHAVLVAGAASVVQCTYRVQQRYPLYRTIFSVAAEAIAIAAAGFAYTWLGGGAPPFDVGSLTRPLVGAIGMYFVANTGSIAAAIALSSGRGLFDVWRREFLWSGLTYMVAGSAGALAAIVIDRGEPGTAVLLVAPVYLTYRTYQLFLARLQDQQRHVAEIARLHRESVEALAHAHEAERALAVEKERLAEANRLKDEFLAVVSHELRTPLNAILGWSDMLNSGRIPDGSRERAYRTIFESAKRQAQLVDDLLDVARIMSGQLRLQRTFVDLEEIVRAALQVVQSAADAKGARIEVAIAGASGLVYGDRVRLQQVAWNLLSNAIKFSGEGGAVRVSLRRAGDAIELSVSDDGCGIPDAFLSSLFEPFRQADGSTTRRHGGLGLGLSIAKHLVEAHGGVIAARSGGEGHGATFTVTLPLVVLSSSLPEGALEPAGLHDAALASVSLAGISVLVVDDDEASRQVVAAHLESRNAAVFTAASAAEAMHILRRQPVHVLLADIGMPGEDGYELIRKVRALDDPAIASVPAAALTAFARSEDRLRALRAGYQLHVAKPVDARALVDAVETLVGRSGTRRGGGTAAAPQF